MILAFISLITGAIAGWIGQRSRFCSVGGIRDLILVQDTRLLLGSAAISMAAWVMVPIVKLAGQVSLGSTNDEYAERVHTDVNGIGNEPNPNFNIELLAVVGLGGMGLGFFSVLADGCPFRQHVLAGQGYLGALLYLLGFYCAALLFQYWSVPLIRLILG